jgi:sulfate adenylyltransferase subunit 1
MDLLRIATAGSVDDGKSTLIGRLLYETGSVPKDRLDSVAESSRRRGLAAADLSLLTDGLMAERAQGITIDVAHVYFSTARRKYIIADVPGHVEYTRNMVTGASTAAVALVLVEAGKGPVEQTHRHLFIAALLRIPQVVICVNKMDLVDWREARFLETCDRIHTVAARLGLPASRLLVVPVCSLHGDNVVARSVHMPWYTGPTLLDALERSDGRVAGHSLRLHVQCVIRSGEGSGVSRRYAGRIASGALRPGDAVLALPGGTTTRVVALERGGDPVAIAHAGQSVSVQLADAVDLDRGGLVASAADPPPARTELLAGVCWLDHDGATSGRVYQLQHGVRRVRARLTGIVSVMDPATLGARLEGAGLRLNDVAVVRLRLGEPIFADNYAADAGNGAFILIDEVTRRTAAVGFVDGAPADRA